MLIKPSRIVVSERGLKETGSKKKGGETLCPMTSTPYTDEDLVILHQHLHDGEKLAEEHKEFMKTVEAENKKKKKKKKSKDEDAEGDAEEGGPSKKSKVDPSATIKEKSKSSVYTSLFRDPKLKNTAVSAEDLLMKGVPQQ